MAKRLCVQLLALEQLAQRWEDSAITEFMDGDQQFASGMNQCAEDLRKLLTVASSRKPTKAQETA
jgi:hypothetical protein